MEPLLNLHRQREEMAKSRLGQAVAKYNEELCKLTGINQELESAREQSRHPLSDGNEFRQSHTFLRLLAARLKKQQDAVNGWEREVTRLRQELLNLRQEVKKFERLRDRRLLEFQYAELRQEQSNLDEIAQGRVSPNSFGGRRRD